MRQNLINSVQAITAEELQAADAKFPDFYSTHEGYAVILEEVEELQAELNFIKNQIACWWEIVKRNDINENDFILNGIETAAINAACEAIQVAAMCRKFKRLME